MAKRGRKSLSAADKAHMAERREAAKAEKATALEAVQSNPQFQNPKFWATAGLDICEAVTTAIRKAGQKSKAKEIKALKAKLEALESEG